MAGYWVGGFEMRKIRINPAGSYAKLKETGVPYTVLNSSFTLNYYLRTIECNWMNARYKTDTVIIHEDDQIKYWHECVRSISSNEDTGWALCISGPGTIVYPQAVAAQLCVEYLKAGRIVKWINVSGSSIHQRELKKLMSPYQLGDVNAVVFNGLRWESNDTRFDKVFDLMQDTLYDCDKIIVGCGENPIAISRRIGLSVQRAICVTDSQVIHM